MEATCGLPRSVSNSYQLGATSLVNHELPSRSSYRFVSPPAPDRQVCFGLLPAAEISSTPTRWNPGTKDIREEKIQQIRVALDHRHNVRQQQMEDANNTWYNNCADVSMNNHPSVREASDEWLPEIAPRHFKQGDRLFEFEAKPMPVPRGELGRYHTGSAVPRHVASVVPPHVASVVPASAVPPHGAPLRKARPVISPLRFYQGNTVPPSARASKGKQRAHQAPVAGSSRVTSHPPSSPLRYRYVKPYAQQQYPSNGVAGSSQDPYM